MSSVNQIYGEIKSEEEMRSFMEAQHKTINQLTEQLRESELKIKQLEDMVSAQTPLVGAEPKNNEYSSDEEFIAREQLKYFAGIAADREFTLEETKKVDIYAKLLLSLTMKEKKPKSELTSMSPAQLLKFVEE